MNSSARLSFVLSVVWLGLSASVQARPSCPLFLVSSGPEEPPIPHAHARPALPAPRGYSTYRNNRFGFSISYPRALLTPVQERWANGAGEVFKSRDGQAELTVFGEHNAMDKTLLELMQDNISDEGKRAKVTMKQVQKDWYAVSGTSGTRIFFIKEFVVGDRVNCFIFHYPRNRKSCYDPVVTELERTFRPAPLNYMGKFVRVKERD